MHVNGSLSWPYTPRIYVARVSCYAERSWSVSRAGEPDSINTLTQWFQGSATSSQETRGYICIMAAGKFTYLFN
jgi:hypothetical protein